LTSTVNTFEAEQASVGYVFELFVCGMTKKSLKTINAVKTVLDQELPRNYTLTVIDIFKNPQFTKQTQIMITPTLIKKYPLPIRHIAGDITVKNRIFCGLNITL
jgi:circadian clock protein KaiB